MNLKVTRPYNWLQFVGNAYKRPRCHNKIGRVHRRPNTKTLAKGNRFKQHMITKGKSPIPRTLRQLTDLLKFW